MVGPLRAGVQMVAVDRAPTSDGVPKEIPVTRARGLTDRHTVCVINFVRKIARLEYPRASDEAIDLCAELLARRAVEAFDKAHG